MSKNLYYEDELEKRSFNFGMMKAILSYAKKYKKQYILVLVFLALNSLLALIPTTLNALIIDKVLPNDGALLSGYKRTAIIVISIWISIMIGQVIVSYVNNIITLRLGNSIVCELRNDMFDKLMKLGFDYYDGLPTGKILVRITSYCDEISEIFINHLTAIIVNVFMMFLTLVIALSYQATLVSIALVVEIPLLLIVAILIKNLKRCARLTRNKNSNRTAFVAEDINGVDVIHSFNREKMNGDIIDELTDKTTHAFMLSTHYREAIHPLAHGVIRAISLAAVYIASLKFLTDNPEYVSLGIIISVTTYMRQFSDAVFNLCQRLQNITTLSTNLERIFELMYEDVQIKDKENAIILPKVTGHVEYKDVTFAYNTGNVVLRNINLDVKPGEMIALVGPTGGGKTTLVSLLSRFYDIEDGSGKILVDGVSIKDCTLESLRRQVCAMMQDTYLFSREIIENIRFSRPDATDEECIEAAKKVHADEFITKLPDGYHTVLTKQGSQISGGQRQLLSFARLILADPRIIILDEATSNIDTETERKIQAMLKDVLKGRTSFVIAHRLSTIKSADRILFIDDQTIVESGTHDELIAKKGRYYDLVQREQ